MRNEICWYFPSSAKKKTENKNILCHISDCNTIFVAYVGKWAEIEKFEYSPDEFSTKLEVTFSLLSITLLYMSLYSLLLIQFS